MRIANYNINKNIKIEKDHPQICEDKQLNGVCSKGADCEICNSTNEKILTQELKNTFQRKKQSNKFLKNEISTWKQKNLYKNKPGRK